MIRKNRFKNHALCFFVCIFICIFISLLYILKGTMASEDERVIAGYIIDENTNNSISGIKVKIKEVNNESNEKCTYTNDIGFYKISNLSPNTEYIISWEYGNTQYNRTALAEGTQFNICNRNLEVIYMYPKEMENFEEIKDTYNQQLELLFKSVKNSNNKAYDDGTLSKSLADILEEKDDEFKFEEIGKKGWTSLCIIFGQNIQYNDLINDIEDKGGSLNDIENCAIYINSDLNINKNFLQEICDINRIKKNEEGWLTSGTPINLNVIENSKNPQLNFGCVKYNTLINITLKKVENSNTEGQLKGRIMAEEIKVNGEKGWKPVTDGCVVYLNRENYTSSDVIGTTNPNEEGYYSFSGLEPGKFYSLSYEFKEADKEEKVGVNGQNYNIDDESTYIIYQRDNMDQNTAEFVRREPVKNDEDYANIFNYKLEEKLDNEEFVEMLKAENSSGGEYSNNWILYSGGTIYAGVRLKLRDKFSLEVESEMVGYKVVLSNGQVYRQEINKEKSSAKLDDIIMVNIDPKDRYGAKAYIEYKITVTNKSNIPCTGYKLLTGNNLDFNEKMNLLTDEKKASTAGWKSINENDIINQFGIKKIDESRKKEKYLVMNNSNGIGPNDIDEYSLILSTILDENCMFDNVIEIVEYQNNGPEGQKLEYGWGRRNYSQEGMKSIAGNYWNGKDNKWFKGFEKDTGISQILYIMPPTGK